MIKKEYMKPTMQTVALKQRTAILAGSPDAYGMNKKLIDNEEVEEGWQADSVKCIEESVNRVTAVYGFFRAHTGTDPV